MTNDMSIDNFYPVNIPSNILESVYVRQSLDKSHRFYFTQGERKEGASPIRIKNNLYKSENILYQINQTFLTVYTYIEFLKKYLKLNAKKCC